jgi:hypothetical protein
MSEEEGNSTTVQDEMDLTTLVGTNNECKLLVEAKFKATPYGPVTWGDAQAVTFAEFVEL